MGERAAKLALECQKRGLPIPESALPPDLEPWDEQYVDQFWELSTDRILGFGGVGPIPSSVIDQRLERLGIADDEVLADDFRAAIAAMDEEFLLVQRERIKAREMAVSKTGSSSPPKAKKGGLHRGSPSPARRR